jgi:hypothetical protein
MAWGAMLRPYGLRSGSIEEVGSGSVGPKLRTGAQLRETDGLGVRCFGRPGSYSIVEVDGVSLRVNGVGRREKSCLCIVATFLRCWVLWPLAVLPLASLCIPRSPLWSG